MNSSFIHGLSLVILSLAAASATADEKLWSTNDTWESRLRTTSNSVEYGGQWPRDSEVADDFLVSGTINRVVVEGRTGGTVPPVPVVEGVYIRFYEWTANGPGALQSEQFVPEGDPDFIHGTPPGRIEVTLPEPFQADGWYFMSAQLVFDDNGGLWSLIQFNRVNPMNETVWFRDNLQGGVWDYDRFFSDRIIADAGFELWGTPGGSAPVIDSLSHQQLERSGRLVISGGLWGGEKGNSEVLIDDIPSWVTRWSSDTIVAYVPEQASLGATTVKVVTAAGTSNEVALNVLAREPQGNLMWRFAVDGDLIRHRAGIGPDGTIYVNDYNKAFLYALTPDGGLKWIADTLQGQEGNGSAGPIVVAPDGTIYVGTNPLGATVELVAFNPDGTLKWVFTIPDGFSWNAGPGVDDEGNVYGVINLGDPFDVFSLDSAGNVRWTAQSDPFVWTFSPSGTELAFGPSSADGGVDQLIFYSNRLAASVHGFAYGFDMADGSQNFAVEVPTGGQTFQQPQTQPAADQQTGNFYIAARTGRAMRQLAPDGSPLWLFDPGVSSEMSEPDVANNGNIYVSWNLGKISAVSRQGNELWRHDEPSIFGGPIVGPDGRVLVVGGRPDFGVPGFFKAFDAATGDELFRIDLTNENGGYIAPAARPLFSSDATAAYHPATIVGDPQATTYSYLYALKVGESTGTTLVDVAAAFGTVISGGLAQLMQPDNDTLDARSQFGFSAQEPNILQLRVGAQTTVASPSTFAITVKSRLNNSGGTAIVRLRNWSTNQFEAVHTYPTGLFETTEVMQNINATNRVRAADGRIELAHHQFVIATFSATGFDGFFDWVEIALE